MTKQELINAVSIKGNMTKKDALNAVESVFGAIEDALENNDIVKMVGFGTFSVKERADRMGRNPQNGEKMLIPAHKIPYFSPGKELRDKVK